MKMMENMIQNKLRTVFNDNNIIFDKSRFAGGLTNYNYIMEIHGAEYVIRQPGGMTDLMIDRKIEKVNNQIALDLGINSECVYFDELSGIKVSKLIRDSKNVALTDPCSPSNLELVSGLLKKLHNSNKNFPNVFDWQLELIKYEEIVNSQRGDFFFDYQDMKAKFLDYVKDNLKQTNLVPCHNDTVPENFLIDRNGKGYLIDWEYAGMNEPSWDIAAFILESKLTKEAIEDLLLDYYEGNPTQDEIQKIKCYIMVQDLLWTVWALIRHYNGDDFLDYCYYRYERFKKNVTEIKEISDYSIAEMVKNE